MSKIDLKSLTLKDIKKVFREQGEKDYRGIQTYKWIHEKMVDSIEDITVLSKVLRDKLKKDYTLSNIKILKRYDSKLDDTKKYLFLLEDGNIIESVMMKYRHGASICVSTQVGCRMGCSFCASTKEGLVRNLTPGEMLDQVYQIQKDLSIKVNNIVLMGSGEPLDNYDNVMRFLDSLHSEDGQNIGYRHMTLSTCGIVPKIYQLADEGRPITLSLSLHSPYQDERNEIMPISRTYPIEEIVEACGYYIKKTNRRVTFEYTLIQGINDSSEDAKAIAKLLRGMLCHVNLIPMNPIKETQLKPSGAKYVDEFKNSLEKHKISTTVRRELGGDINAACGQLRRDYLKG